MGQYKVGLVGESNYQRAVKKLRRHDPVKLEHEPANKFDPQAVRASGPDGKTIGYLARDSWLAPLIHTEARVIPARVGEIVGGGVGQQFGVVLDVLTDPREQYEADGLFERVMAGLDWVTEKLEGMSKGKRKRR